MTKPLSQMSLPTLAAAAAAVLCLGLCLAAPALADDPASARPIHALLVTGGCCHDYKEQKVIIPNGLSARVKVEWTIVHEGDGTRDHKLSLYEKPGWADGFDVVVHNECFGMVADRAFINKLIAPHRNGTPAVVIHCSMHSYRALEQDDYREFLGVTSRRHGPQHPLDVKNLARENPIMATFPPAWTTGKEELYAIEKVWPDTTPLAQARDLEGKDHTVIWAHMYGKTRVFGTTLAHNNATMRDTVYLDMLARGLLWACDKLEKDGKPKAGYSATSGQ